MTDMAPSRKSVNPTTVDPAAPKGKGKVIEAAEPTDRQPNLSDVHISDVEDSSQHCITTQDADRRTRASAQWRPIPSDAILHAEVDGESADIDDLTLRSHCL